MESVKEFYKNKSVFVTGASGFMGKVLVEKLLYSCPDLKQIFILMREKRGKSGAQRVSEFSSLPLFDRIVRNRPELLDKLVPVYGDISRVDLGLDETSLALVLAETNIVFHMAATLIFDAPLKVAVEMNVRGVQYVIELAKRMANLVAMVHLSTTFCCCDQEVLREEVYDSNVDPKELIRAAEWMSEDAMNELRKTMIAPHPNTYTYTKRLGEVLVRDEYENLPICICRPSIVLPTFREPMPGWVDNLNGPIGVLLGAGKGVIRSMLCEGSNHAEVAPVDLCINGLILVAWEMASTRQKPPKIPVFNFTTPEKYRYTWSFALEQGRKLIQEYPFEAGIWYPGGDITTNRFVHSLRVFFTQWIPAYLVDGLCVLVGRPRFLVRIQQKISDGMHMLQYFSMRKWDFRSENVFVIGKKLSAEEFEEFPVDLDNPNVVEFLKACILGGRQYCLKEPLTTLPKARVQLKLLRVLDYLSTFLLALLVVYLFKLFARFVMP